MNGGRIRRQRCRPSSDVECKWLLFPVPQSVTCTLLSSVSSSTKMRSKMWAGRHAVCIFPAVSVFVIICTPWYVLMCSGVHLGDTGVGFEWPQNSRPGCPHWWVRSSFWQEGSGAARRRSLEGKRLLAKTCCRWRSQPVWMAMTLRGAIWQELPCSMSAGDCPGLEWIRDAAEVAGGTNNHLVSRPLLILLHQQGRASASRGEAELSVTRSDRHNRISPVLLYAPQRGF